MGDEQERIARARAFIAANPRGVLTTYRRDGQAQMSPITPGVDAEGRVVISVTDDRAKTKNARRDPRVALCVFSEGFYGPWVQVEGQAAFADGPDRIDALVDYYRSLSGEHPDWSDYRAAMVRERRVLLRFDIARASGPAAG
ncbi:MAG: PPOX class F420-dependent oxidoreductase [Actinocrinis sp.]